MHPLDYSESVPGRKPTTGRQAATSRGTSTGMHTVGCSRMCACQQCCTPLPYHKFVHTDLILQPVCLVAMGIAWCNDVALVQRRRTARVWIHPGGHQAGTNKQAKQRADRVGKQTTGSSPTAKASIGMATYGGKLDASGQPWWLSGGPTASFKGPA